MQADNKQLDLSGGLAIDLLNAAPDSTVIVDTEGRIAFANEQVLDVFGYEPAELIGQPIESLLPERFRFTHVRHRSSFVENPKPRPMGAGLDLFALHKDGREFPVEISLGALETPSGVLILSAIRDVSDRKAIERALIDARDEADRANRAKSAFLAAASHDLRQPLQTLALLNTALNRIVKRGSKASDVAAGQGQALSSMSELLDSLLDISKLEAGAITPDIEDCSVSEIFERLRSRFSAAAESKGLELLVEECDDIVRTDPTLLEQIIQNLVANAIRYTKEGLVRLRCLRNAASVRIEIVDTGIGIPFSELQSVFDEFYQVSREPGQRKEGLGLGLSIVRRLTDLLGLELEVDSTLGRGSRFSLEVPRGIAAERPAAAAPPARRAQDTRGKVVLVVDDDRAVADATAMLLEVEGHRTLIAGGLDEARRRFADADGAPDLIICDFRLGSGLTGVETIGELREMGQRTIPAVLVTGDTSMAVADLAGRLDKCRVLSKPIDADELLVLLQEIHD